MNIPVMERYLCLHFTDETLRLQEAKEPSGIHRARKWNSARIPTPALQGLCCFCSCVKRNIPILTSKCLLMKNWRPWVGLQKVPCMWVNNSVKTLQVPLSPDYYNIVLGIWESTSEHRGIQQAIMDWVLKTWFKNFSKVGLDILKFINRWEFQAMIFPKIEWFSSRNRFCCFSFLPYNTDMCMWILGPIKATSLSLGVVLRKVLCI